MSDSNQKINLEVAFAHKVTFWKNKYYLEICEPDGSAIGPIYRTKTDDEMIRHLDHIHIHIRNQGLFELVETAVSDEIAIYEFRLKPQKSLFKLDK